ncbi:MAG TPA: alpha/beta hydrolase [Acidimicrobiales bacterium]|nr:alpha/beta hydrolase [Acidimicrobiales bacterium]
MRRLLMSATGSLLLLVVAACSPLATPAGPAPLRYRDDVFSSVSKTADITYGTAVNAENGQTVTLKLDLYQPTGDTVTSRPAIVWVHGGSFCCGSKTSAELVDEANTFARKGFVNVSIDYRLVSSGCPGSDINACLTAIRQAREDAQTAVRFLREQAATYRIDPTRIAIGGSSAGAITALNVGYSPENPGPGDHQGFSSAVGAVQSISGAELASGPIDAGDAPALLFHGTSDPLVPYSWAQSTVDRATAAGLVAILRTWEGEGHVPYSQHRTQILDETRNFFYSQMDLANAAR